MEPGTENPSEYPKYKVPVEHSWHDMIDIITDNVLNKKNYTIKKLPDVIKELRDLLYQLFITNIDFHTIIKEIMNSIKNKLTYDNMTQKLYYIIEETSKFENRISQGTRHIVHLEAYLIKLIQILNV